MGTATGIGIGAAAGIATGDPNTVLKNIGLGASIGSSVGTGVSDRVVSGLGGNISQMADKTKERYTESKKERYGDDYQKMENAKNDLKFSKDKEKRAFYENKFKEQLNGLTGKARKEKVDEIMNDAVRYRQAGVMDDDVIAKAMNLKANGATSNDRTSNDSILAAQMFTKGKDLNGIEKYEKQLGKRFGEERIAGIADNARKIGGLYK